LFSLRQIPNDEQLGRGETRAEIKMMNKKIGGDGIGKM